MSINSECRIQGQAQYRTLKLPMEVENRGKMIKIFSACILGWILIVSSIVTISATELDDASQYAVATVLFLGAVCVSAALVSYCMSEDREYLQC